jgi:hypothetical protein
MTSVHHGEYVVGIVLALGVAAFARLTGLDGDRDRGFYPTMTVAIASYYVLFAVMGGSAQALLVDTIAMAAFAVVAVMGFRSTLWLVVIALAAHGVFDAFHDHLITNTGVPEWWPAFCGAFDVTAAGTLAWRCLAAPTRARLPSERGVSSPLSR